MREIVTRSTGETEQAGEAFARTLSGGCVVALFGGLGHGKTAFVRGMAAGRGLCAEVSSPTFALVHDYGGSPPLVHFDMYRVTSWDDLYSTGFFDYVGSGAIVVVEWSENVLGALPEGTVFVRIDRLSDSERRITIGAPAPKETPAPSSAAIRGEEEDA